MPKLIRLYIVSVAIGFAVAAIFAAELIALDIGGLRHLVQGQDGWLGAFLLWFFNGIVFAGVQFAFQIMRMAEKDDRPRGGTRAPVTPARLQPVKVEATARKRH